MFKKSRTSNKNMINTEIIEAEYVQLDKKNKILWRGYYLKNAAMTILFLHNKSDV